MPETTNIVTTSLFRAKIEKSAQDSRAKSKRMNVTASRRGGKYPGAETVVYDQYRKRRYLKGLKVSGKWLRAKMKAALAKQQPPGWDTFKYSDQWFDRFKKRHNIVLRRRTNKKSKTLEERLPKIREFHRKVKSMRQTPPARDPKYGRWAAKKTAHVDQVRLRSNCTVL